MGSILENASRHLRKHVHSDTLWERIFCISVRSKSLHTVVQVFYFLTCLLSGCSAPDLKTKKKCSKLKKTPTYFRYYSKLGHVHHIYNSLPLSKYIYLNIWSNFFQGCHICSCRIWICELDFAFSKAVATISQSWEGKRAGCGSSPNISPVFW